MRDSGKGSKVAIQGVIKDIGDYTAIVRRELRLILEDVAAFSEVWKDDKFIQFTECVERMKSGVERGLNAIEEARASLKEKTRLL